MRHKMIFTSMFIFLILFIFTFAYADCSIETKFFKNKNIKARLLDANSNTIVIVDNNIIRYFDVNLDNKLNVIERNFGFIKFLKIDDKGNVYIASDNNVAVLDNKGNEIFRKSTNELFNEKNSEISDFKVINNYVILGSNKGEVCVLNVNTQNTYDSVKLSNQEITGVYYNPQLDEIVAGSYNNYIYFKIGENSPIKYKCKSTIEYLTAWKNYIVAGDSVGNVYFLTYQGDLIDRRKVSGGVKKIYTFGKYLVILDDSDYINVFDESLNNIYYKRVNKIKCADLKNNKLAYGGEKLGIVVLPGKYECNNDLLQRFSPITNVKWINNKLIFTTKDEVIELLVNVTKTPPNIVIKSPIPGYLYYENTPIEIKAYAKDNTGVKKIIAKIDGKEIASCKSNFIITNVELKRGNHKICIESVNNLGLHGYKSINIHINEPKPGKLIITTIPEHCNISIISKDGNYNKHFISPVDVVLPAGIYYIEATKFDYYPNKTKVIIYSGNKTDIFIKLNKIDHKPKVVLTISCLNNGIITTEKNYANVKVDIKAEDDLKVNKIEIYVDNKLYKTYTVNKRNYEKTDIIKLSRGTHNIYVKVYDSKNQYGISSKDIKIVKLPITYITIVILLSIFITIYLLVWKKSS